MGRRVKSYELENLLLDRAGAKGIALGNAPDGKVVMVKGGVPGDRIKARVFRKKKKYYEAELLEVQTPSEHRIKPECKHFGVCGGCKWQHMEYSHQLFWKQKEVTDNLQRIAGIYDFPMHPIVGSKEQYYYRNKMEFSFSNARWLTKEQIQTGEEIKSRNALGFHIPGMWSKVLDLKECHLQAEPSNDLRLAVKEFSESNNYDFFDLREQKGFLRTFMLRTSSTGEAMVLFQFFENNPDQIKALFEHLIPKFPAVASWLYAINNKGNDSVYDLEIENYAGRDFIWEEMEGLKFKIGPKSFYQTNSDQAQKLYEITRDMAGLTGEELVYDLYTGTGTIAQFVSKQAKKVIGIESVPEAITAAKDNAVTNGIENCEFHCGDMKNVLTTDFVKQNGMPDVIIADPPRDGMHAKVVECIMQVAPQRIVYVSCNSATQARDLVLLKEKYNVEAVQPVDMFPHTHHVENIVLLQKKVN